MTNSFIFPNWPAPKHIKAVSSTRIGGFSTGDYQGLNLGMHVGDDAALVEKNRQWLAEQAQMPSRPVWLNQTHSTQVVSVEAPTDNVLDADASTTLASNLVCVVMTADCLPVLLTNQQGTQVAAVHAGWRGLVDGIVEKAVQSFDNPVEVMAWIGPAIGPQAFEVGQEVKDQFVAVNEQAQLAFTPTPSADPQLNKYLADMNQLVTQRLNAVGVTAVYYSQLCTYQHSDRFYSYRRDGVTGRQASFIWIASSSPLK